MASYARLAVADGVLHREMPGGAVVLNLSTGQYHGLDEVGARAWALLLEHGALAPVLQAMLAEYDVDAARLEADLRDLVADLVARGLLVAHEA